MADPLIASARYAARDDYRRSLDGLGAAALNWRPAGDDTNSLAVLTVHAWSSTRSWLSVAMGAALPDRDRDEEFRAWAADPDELRAWFEDIAAQSDALLTHGGPIDWAVMRRTHGRPNPGDPQEVPAAFALIHAVEHLREHEGQASLTRQLWLAKA